MAVGEEGDRAVRIGALEGRVCFAASERTGLDDVEAHGFFTIHVAHIQTARRAFSAPKQARAVVGDCVAHGGRTRAELGPDRCPAFARRQDAYLVQLSSLPLIEALAGSAGRQRNVGVERDVAEIRGGAGDAHRTDAYFRIAAKFSAKWDICEAFLAGYQRGEGGGFGVVAQVRGAFGSLGRERTGVALLKQRALQVWAEELVVVAVAYQDGSDGCVGRRDVLGTPAPRSVSPRERRGGFEYPVTVRGGFDRAAGEVGEGVAVRGRLDMAFESRPQQRTELLRRGDHLPGAPVGKLEAKRAQLGGEALVGALDDVDVAVAFVAGDEAVVVGGPRGEVEEGGGDGDVAEARRQGALRRALAVARGGAPFDPPARRHSDRVEFGVQDRAGRGQVGHPLGIDANGWASGEGRVGTGGRALHRGFGGFAVIGRYQPEVVGGVGDQPAERRLHGFGLEGRARQGFGRRAMAIAFASAPFEEIGGFIALRVEFGRQGHRGRFEIGDVLVFGQRARFGQGEGLDDAFGRQGSRAGGIELSGALAHRDRVASEGAVSRSTDNLAGAELGSLFAGRVVDLEAVGAGRVADVDVAGLVEGRRLRLPAGVEGFEQRSRSRFELTDAGERFALDVEVPG